MDFILKFIKFGLVGFTGLIIDFGITWLCKEVIKLNKFIANSCGFCVAVVNNYLLNRYWTFHSSNKNWQSEMGLFVLISIIGLLLNNLLIYILNEKMKFNFYVAKGVATVCVVVWNFGANMAFTFK